jgi:hypothetical protein
VGSNANGSSKTAGEVRDNFVIANETQRSKARVEFKASADGGPTAKDSLNRIWQQLTADFSVCRELQSSKARFV